MAVDRNFIDTKRYPKRETLQVAVPSTFVRRGPRPSSAAETELLFGTLFHVHRFGRGWVWGQSECQLPGVRYPGYVGWCRTRDLAIFERPDTHKIISMGAPVFTESNIKSPVQHHLSLSSTFRTLSIEDSFLQIEDGFLHKAHSADIQAPCGHADWVQIAEGFLGRPYVWGGISSFGLDCSGLIQTALRMSGSDAPRDSDQQAEIGDAVKIETDLSGLKRGDLIFWKGHVGVMTSPTRLLHANAWHMGVATEPLKTAVKRITNQAGPITAIRKL